jgi:hypothetical protein
MATVHEALIGLAQMDSVLALANLIRNDEACIGPGLQIPGRVISFVLKPIAVSAPPTETVLRRESTYRDCNRSDHHHVSSPTSMSLLSGNNYGLTRCGKWKFFIF